MFLKASKYSIFSLILIALLAFLISIATGIGEPSESGAILPSDVMSIFQEDLAYASDGHSMNHSGILTVLPYEIGTPILRDLWVDPSHGNDANTGSTSSQALRTLTEAWSRVPKRTALSSTGYRIRLQPGDYPDENMPGFWELAIGSASYPVIIQAEGARGTTRLHGYVDLQNSRYVYLINLSLVTDRGYGGGGNVLHLANCSHILVRGCTLSGFDGSQRQPQEALKANQVQYLYVEDCDISGAFWFPLDWVAVQYGHIIHSKIHNAGDWAAVLKGGSAYITVDCNEIYDGVTGGFTAGQGTGFNWMVSPWLHYEASDIKFINNIVHDTGTVGIGINGGYNILMAYNTLYNAGINDHVIEVVHGMRGCDGDFSRCSANRAAGGWGTAGESSQYIPCANVFIYNNLIYNPTSRGYQTLVIHGPVTPPSGSNVPSPSRTDVNLQIRGNIIWNGPEGMSLLGDSSGCQPGNPTCYESKLLADNAVRTIEPQLVDPQHGNFNPVPGGNIFSVVAYAVPDFAG